MTECLIANYSLIAVQFLFGNNMQTIYFKPLKGIQKSSLFQKKISALFKLNFFIISLKSSENFSNSSILKPADQNFIASSNFTSVTNVQAKPKLYTKFQLSCLSQSSVPNFSLLGLNQLQIYKLSQSCITNVSFYIFNLYFCLLLTVICCINL